MDNERKYSPQELKEVEEIRARYNTLCVDSSYGAVNTERIESLLNELRKYPVHFKEEIKAFEESLKERQLS